MAVMRRPKRAQFDSVAAAARHFRAGLPYWRLANDLGGVNPDNIRALEKRQRPMTALARRVLAALNVPLEALDRDLDLTLEGMIAEWPVEDRVVFRDAVLMAARRFRPGGEVNVRIEEEPAVGRVATAGPGRPKKTSRGSNSIGRVQPLPTSAPHVWRPFVIAGQLSRSTAA